jgi:hypothetical protein
VTEFGYRGYGAGASRGRRHAIWAAEQPCPQHHHAMKTFTTPWNGIAAALAEDT